MTGELQEYLCGVGRFAHVCCFNIFDPAVLAYGCVCGAQRPFYIGETVTVKLPRTAPKWQK